jgi:hypothetical protein
MNNDNLFRRLAPDFLNDLRDKSNKLNYVLDYERKNRGVVILEIRNNFLDIYFLGHGIVVKKIKKNSKYCLIGSSAFNPKSSLSSERLRHLVKDHGKTWQIYIEEIENNDDFKEIMDTVISKIVLHRKGGISEGVSEVNHIFENRDIGRNGILIIDRQVAYPGIGNRLDLLGIRRLEDANFTFSVIELKNKNNIEIGSVFSQLRQYIDIVFEHYDSFMKTYTKVIDQKIKLGLLKKIKFQIVPKEKISRKDIKGVIILDNYNIKSDLKSNGLMHRALNDWANQSDNYSFELFLKTNVLDSTFFYDYLEAKELLTRFKTNNAK